LERRDLGSYRYCGSGRSDHALGPSVNGASIAALTDEDIGLLLGETGVGESRLEDPLFKSKDVTLILSDPQYKSTGVHVPMLLRFGTISWPRSACRIPQISI
jgi:hypothetical protein